MLLSVMMFNSENCKTISSFIDKKLIFKLLDIVFRSGMKQKYHFHVYMRRVIGSTRSPFLCRATIKIHHNTVLPPVSLSPHTDFSS